MKNYISLFALILFANSPIISQSGKIIVNKKPRTTNTNKPSNTYPNNTKTTPTNTNTNRQQQQRAQHANVQKLDHLELRYTVSELGQTQKHNHYRISGHIYSNLNEPIYCHNRRIVMFQIDNWDSGFLNDNLQSIDGYPTQHRLNPQGVLSVFGNSTVREFAFDFKVKRGLQPRVRSEIMKDWAPLADYEKYLLLEYSMLNGTWHMEQNQEAKFNLQFAPQGKQLMMKDIFGNQISWTMSEGNTYIRKIGNVPNQSQAQTQQQQPSQNSNSSSNYPSGGYLGNGNKNQNQPNNNQRNTNQNKPSNYPSGGYLGNGNGNGNNNSQTNTQGNTNAGGAYSSVIEIVDRNTIRYRNSEGIVCLLKKTAK